MSDQPISNTLNTLRGQKSEGLFAQCLEEHPIELATLIGAAADIDELVKVIDRRILVSDASGTGGLSIDAGTLKIEIVGSRLRKSDVVVRIDIPNTPDLRFSVKSFSDSGFNHLARLSVEDFCKFNKIRKGDQRFLNNMINRKGSGGRLVEPSEEDRVVEILSPLDVGLTALLGCDHPQFFVIQAKLLKEFLVYKMQTVTKLVRQAPISISSRGTIELGRYITLQRKGEEGKGGKRPNDLQFKILVKKIAEEVDPFVRLKY